MPEVQLTKGKIAIVDSDDIEKVNQYKWHVALCGKDYYAKGYITRTKPIHMSRLIMGLLPGDKRQVDHINHDTLDNRKENLRIVTLQQNCQNRKNVKGYYWNKEKAKWVAQIRVNYKTIFLGCFNNEADAHQAYLNGRKKFGFIEV